MCVVRGREREGVRRRESEGEREGERERKRERKRNIHELASFVPSGENLTAETVLVCPIRSFTYW